MRKLLIILLILCVASFAQNAKSKFVVSISGELDLNTSDALADIINRAVIKSQKYSVLPNDRQFRETLKKEWKKGNVSDDKVISLAKNAGADYLCFAKITPLLGSNQIAVQLVNLKSEPMEYSDMGIARGKLNDLDIFAQKIEEAVDDMLGVGKQVSKREPEIPKENPAQKSGNVFTDSRNGKQYKIVTIGNQIWMAENLNYNASGSICYGNNPDNCEKYGRLYDWEMAMKACPKGWHLPRKSEWEVLTESVGGKKTANKYLKATSGWASSGLQNRNGTDSYGFTALPGGNGELDGSGRSFTGIGYDGKWWSSSLSDGENPYYLSLESYRDGANWNLGNRRDELIMFNEGLMLSVRCVQD